MTFCILKFAKGWVLLYDNLKCTRVVLITCLLILAYFILFIATSSTKRLLRFTS